MKNIKIFIITTLALISFSELFAKDIPVLVISPGKTIQSESIVGSTVEVVTSDDIENSSEKTTKLKKFFDDDDNFDPFLLNNSVEQLLLNWRLPKL